MAHTTFEQDIFVVASPALVQERLTRLMTTVTEMHPLVIGVQHVETTMATDGTPVEHYLVHDRMKLGPFTGGILVCRKIWQLRKSFWRGRCMKARVSE